jgi:hypothetical protein
LRGKQKKTRWKEPMIGGNLKANFKKDRTQKAKRWRKGTKTGWKIVRRREKRKDERSKGGRQNLR